MEEQSLAKGKVPILQNIQIAALPLERFAPLVGERCARRMRAAMKRAQALLEGRTLWNVSSTATGGGVAEMLRPLLA